ncbi:hypothetical protein [Sabulicella rubraurantiaca]|uniref:hypothetical protein n=1 Tax=Sabulicella rubraurantiaca TaxID=2811429 RepID=UPI001A970621|nr:hypothetical protein [Sabulicella rubraurantiaca]
MSRLLLLAAAAASLVTATPALAQRLENCPQGVSAGPVVRQMDPQDFSRQVYFVPFANTSGRGVYYRLRLAGSVTGFQPDNGLLNNRVHMLQHGQSSSFRAGTAERRPYPAAEAVGGAVVIACLPG